MYCSMLPLIYPLQVAVKALRFSFTMEEGASNSTPHHDPGGGGVMVVAGKNERGTSTGYPRRRRVDIARRTRRRWEGDGDGGTRRMHVVIQVAR